MFGVLGTRLAVLAMLASAVVALLGALVAFRFIADAEVEQARERIEVEIGAQRETFGQSLWNYDDAQINALLDGLLNIPEIRRATVRAREGDEWVRGIKPDSGASSMVLSLTRGASSPPLGTLTVWFDFTPIEGTLDKLQLASLAIVITASLVTGLVVLLLFQRLIGRHLGDLAEFLGEHGSGERRRPAFRIARRARLAAAADELDQIEDALERMLDTERRLRDTETRLVSALENSRVGYALFDVDDRLAFVNPEYRRLFSTPGDLLVPGTRFEDVLRGSAERGDIGEAAGRVDEWLAWRLERHRESAEPFELFRPGTQRWVRIQEERLPGGETFLIVLDITEQRELEKELARHRDHLEELVEARSRELESVQGELLRSERLAAIGQLVGKVSHELRNPLGTIRTSFVTVRGLVRAGEPRLVRALDRIERNIDRCVRIIEELLSYARGHELRVSRFEVDPWLESVVGEFEIPGSVKLELEPGCGVEVSADPERLRQAVFNVVQNACQAMSEREDGWTGNHLRIASECVDDQARIEITDTGPGISPEEIGEVFEPLYSTRAFGVGLGLPLVRSILEEHGGGVDISSQPDAGTTLVLWLPLG